MELAERWTRLYQYPQICIHIYPRGRPGYIMKTTYIRTFIYLKDPPGSAASSPAGPLGSWSACCGPGGSPWRKVRLSKILTNLRSLNKDWVIQADHLPDGPSSIQPGPLRIWSACWGPGGFNQRIRAGNDDAGLSIEFYLRFFSCCSDIGMDWIRLNDRFRFSSLVSLPVS